MVTTKVRDAVQQCTALYKAEKTDRSSFPFDPHPVHHTDHFRSHEPHARVVPAILGALPGCHGGSGYTEP